jgi:hypothetical protein
MEGEKSAMIGRSDHRDHGVGVSSSMMMMGHNMYGSGSGSPSFGRSSR